MSQRHDNLAYAAGRDDVSHVWVAGEPLVWGRTLQNERLSSLESRMYLWQNALSVAGS